MLFTGQGYTMVALTRVALLSLLLGWPGPSHATVDSWLVVKFPLADMQVENANCEASTVVLDAHSSGPHSTAKTIIRTLTQPIEVGSPLAAIAQKVDANAITDGAKAPVSADLIVDEVKSNLVVRLTVDVTALAKLNGDAQEGRQDTVRRAKQVVLYALTNFLRRHEKQRVAVMIAGLPSQDGLPGMTLPASASPPMSAVSPMFRKLAEELKPPRPCPRG